MKTNNEINSALAFLNSDERKRYSAQRIDDGREQNNDLSSTMNEGIKIITEIDKSLCVNDIIECGEDIKPRNFSELIKCEGVEKTTELVKIYYVKNEVKKQIRQKLGISSISEDNQLYLDVFKVESGILEGLDDINPSLKEELNILVISISSKIIDTLEKTSSVEEKLIKASDLDNFGFHDLRYILENKVYQKLCKIKDIPRGQVYLYKDINTYYKLQEYHETESDGSLDELVEEFSDFYLKNEELFIKRYKENEQLADSHFLNFELVNFIENVLNK